MKWQDKRVLVTGAGGFIGSHLVDELLNKGADVTEFVHYKARNDWGIFEGRYDDKTPNLNVIAGDVTDSLFVKKAVSEKDYVFHLAALIGMPYSYVAPESYINTNIKDTLNIMQACLDAGVDRVVHTSTSEVFSIIIEPPQPVLDQTISPISRTSFPTLSWGNNCNTKFKVWFGSDESFNKKNGYSFNMRNPNDNGGIFTKMLTSGQWKAIRKLVGDVIGPTIYWYVESWDGLKRYNKTDVMSFVLTE